MKNHKQVRWKQIKSEGAEKIHWCLPYVRRVKFFVDIFGYLLPERPSQ